MPHVAPPLPYRVQIVPDTHLAYFREVVLGAMRYAFETGRLAVADRWLEHEATGRLRRLVQRDAIQGILAPLHTQESERRYTRLGLPVVNVSNSMFAPRCPVVTQDDRAVGRLAAEHLRSCGCTHFGFWGEERSSYSTQRLEGFREVLGGAQLAYSETPRCGETPLQLYRRILAFTRSLPPHAGVFAVLDSYALYFLRAARELGRRVPDDLLVLGSGNDDFYVELESIPLSSIRLPAREIGYEAARLLDQLITSGKLYADNVQVSKCQIVPRKSTDALRFDDPAVTRAMAWLRTRPSASVADLVRAAGVSRTGLQQRFRKAVGRGMLEEIHHRQMLLARELLLGTDLKLEAIAEQLGLASVQRFTVLFKRHHGLAPGAYRRWQRAQW